MRMITSSHRKNRGVVLLLTLMVVAILVVVVGQFASTAVLDTKIARNRGRQTQLLLDARAGVEAALSVLSDEPPGEAEAGRLDVVLEREEATIRVHLEDETGKFNLNALKTPPKGITADRAEEVYRRLMDLADDPAGTLPPACAESILAFVRDEEGPLPTLESLLAVEGVTKELLHGPGEGGPGGREGGLSALLTVRGGGRIRPGVGDDRVLLALSGKMNPKVLQMALDYIRDPVPKPPPQVAALAGDVLPWIVWESDAFTATIEASREGCVKKAKAAFKRNGEVWRLETFDELR